MELLTPEILAILLSCLVGATTVMSLLGILRVRNLSRQMKLHSQWFHQLLERLRLLEQTVLPAHQLLQEPPLERLVQALFPPEPQHERQVSPLVHQFLQQEPQLAPTHQQTVQALQLAERAPQLRREQTLQAIQEQTRPPLQVAPQEQVTLRRATPELLQEAKRQLQQEYRKAQSYRLKSQP